MKRFENGFILDPFTVSPDAKLSQLDEIKLKHGFSGCPVTEDGKLNGGQGAFSARHHCAPPLRATTARHHHRAPAWCASIAPRWRRRRSRRP